MPLIAHTTLDGPNVRTDDGTVFSFGQNDKGQLGHSRDDSHIPVSTNTAALLRARFHRCVQSVFALVGPSVSHADYSFLGCGFERLNSLLQ